MYSPILGMASALSLGDFGHNRCTPPTLLDAGTVTTNWGVASGCTKAMTAITQPDGTSVANVHYTGTAPATSSFFTNTVFNLSGRIGLEFDIWPGDPGYTISANNGIYGLIQLTDGTNAMTANFQCAAGQWSHIKMHKNEFLTTAGSPVWGVTNFSVIQWKINALTGWTTDAYIKNLNYLGWQKPNIVIMHDDIGSSVYSAAFPLAKAIGIPLSNACIGQAIDAGTFGGYAVCTSAQLAEMNAAGGDCVNHTDSHAVAGTQATYTSGQAQTEYTNCKNTLISKGLNNSLNSAYMCAGPYGVYTANIYSGINAMGGTYFRGQQWNDGTLASPPTGTRLLSRRNVLCFTVQASTTPAQLLAYVDNCILAGKDLIILFHHITSLGVNPAIEWSVANYTTFMNGMATRRASFNALNFSQYVTSRSIPNLAA